MCFKRRFAKENPLLLNCEEVDDEDNVLSHTADKENNEQSVFGNRRQRRGDTGAKSGANSRKGHGGRVPKGQDWWSQVEQWFKERRLEWTDNMGSPQWKKFDSYKFFFNITNIL